jgi:hypothetical protein
VSRHVLVYGTNCLGEATTTTRKRIAAHNTFTMLTADEQVYSHVSDFCWLDENGAYQTDWKLFSEERFIGAASVGFSFELPVIPLRPQGAGDSPPLLYSKTTVSGGCEIGSIVC